MPATLMDAIEAYWNSAGLDSSVGPFFPLTVDPGVNAPYARGLAMPGSMMRDSSKTYVEESHVQVSVFAPDEVADDLALAAEAALDAIEDLTDGPPMVRQLRARLRPQRGGEAARRGRRGGGEPGAAVSAGGHRKITG
jgi:hypothetical protein